MPSLFPKPVDDPYKSLEVKNIKDIVFIEAMKMLPKESMVIESIRNNRNPELTDIQEMFKLPPEKRPDSGRGPDSDGEYRHENYLSHHPSNSAKFNGYKCIKSYPDKVVKRIKMRRKH